MVSHTVPGSTLLVQPLSQADFLQDAGGTLRPRGGGYEIISIVRDRVAFTARAAQRDEAAICNALPERLPLSWPSLPASIPGRRRVIRRRYQPGTSQYNPLSRPSQSAMGVLQSLVEAFDRA
jgi:hypothetical protein